MVQGPSSPLCPPAGNGQLVQNANKTEQPSRFMRQLVSWNSLFSTLRFSTKKMQEMKPMTTQILLWTKKNYYLLQAFSLVTIYSLLPRGEHSKETKDKALLSTRCLVFILAAMLTEACALQPHPATCGCGSRLLHQAPRNSSSPALSKHIRTALPPSRV